MAYTFAVSFPSFPMRTQRLFLPLLVALALVGCDAWFTASAPGDDAMMDAGSSASSTASIDAMDDDAQVYSSESAMMEDDAMAASSAGTTMEDDAMVEDDDDKPATGSYGAYSPSVLANGRTKVLFFHAAWCPICRNADAQLTAWYQTHPYPLSVYKVDYDTATELKQRYGVTYQHTFVQVDGQGNALKVLQGPTDAQLQALLQA